MRITDDILMNDGTVPLMFSSVLITWGGCFYLLFRFKFIRDAASCFIIPAIHYELNVHLFECECVWITLFCSSVSCPLILCNVITVSLLCLWLWTSVAGATCHEKPEGVFRTESDTLHVGYVWCILLSAVSLCLRFYIQWCVCNSICPCLWLLLRTC